MSLEDLRAKEERVRGRLANVRASLASAAEAISDGAQARTELAVARPSEGVYRDAAVERTAELRARIEAASAAAVVRERMRHEETALLEELEGTRRGIERAGIRRNVLPILDHLPPATPCLARWDEMTGDGDMRTCTRCQATVLNLVMLEPAQAQTLLGARRNLHRRADGTILAGDCPAGQVGARWSRQVALTLTALLVAAAIVFVYAQTRPAPVERATHGDDFGEIVTTDRAKHYEADPHLDRATVVHLRQHYNTMTGPHDFNAKLTRRGSAFAYTVDCRSTKGKASAEGSVDAVQVDTFLRSVNAQESDAIVTRTTCKHTDDYPTYNVEVVTPLKVSNLSVNNCSRQWFLDGKPIAPETAEPSSETPHPTINRAYQALLAALGEENCEANAHK